LGPTVITKDQHSLDLDAQPSLDPTVITKDQHSLDLDAQPSLDPTVITKDQQLTELTTKSHTLEQKLSSMENSIVWQITMKFHTKVVERLLPLNTQRREYYDLVLKGGRIFVNKGLRSFFWHFREYRSKKTVNLIKFLDPLPEFIDIANNDEIDPICKKVSIIILTKNAGDNFAYTLEKIQNQKGIQNIEIIIADCGSKDRTLSLAEEFGAKILNILPEEFNPGETRNLGASQADGEYILFIAQDVIPVGDFWLYNLVSVLENNEKIAAVSCHQIPRSDADLFACFLIWYNNKIHLDFHEDMTDAEWDTHKTYPDFDELGKHGGGENSAFCIRKDIFDCYQFNIIPSAEDFDLEFRLRTGGYEITHLFSDGVIHSHNQTPQYFFKRSYVDTKSISIVTGVNPEVSDNDEDILKLLGGILSLYFTLNKIVTIMKSQQLDISPHKIIEQVKTNIQITTLMAQTMTQYCSGQDSLDELFNEIFPSCSLSSEQIKIEPVPILITRFCCELDEFDRYLSIYESLGDKKNDFFISLYKIFSCISGSSIAKLYLHQSRNENLDEKLINLNNLLCRGV